MPEPSGDASLHGNPRSVEQEAEDKQPAQRRPRRRRWHFLRFLILAMIMASGLAAMQLAPASRAKWYWAASITALEAGDKEEALALAETAIHIAPQEAPLRARYAELLFRLERENEALEQALKSLELNPQNLQLIGRNAYLLGRMRQHEQALKWLDKLIEESLAGGNMHRHHARNQRAYGIALAYADGDATDEDLKQGLEDIELAIEEFGKEPSYLDTRGYLYLLDGRLEEADSDLNKAIGAIENVHGDVLAEMAGRRGSALAAAEAQKQSLESALAVMYHHRAELYEQQNKHKLAERDRLKAYKFGLSRKGGNW